MSGRGVRAVREGLGWTQQQACLRWKMSQAYLSLVEQDKRKVPMRLVRLLARRDRRMATGLPVELPSKATKDLPCLLGAVGYPGYAYLAKHRQAVNPAAVVLEALRSKDVPARVTEALPWVLAAFPNLDWKWLVDSAKLANAQNRLGYVVSLARGLAERQGETEKADVLTKVAHELDDARLAKEDSLGRVLTDAERRHLRVHRPPAAAHWNLLTSLQLEDLRYGA